MGWKAPALIDYVSGMRDVEGFYCIGREGLDNISKNLAKNGLSIDRFSSVEANSFGTSSPGRLWQSFSSSPSRR